MKDFSDCNKFLESTLGENQIASEIMKNKHQVFLFHQIPSLNSFRKFYYKQQVHKTNERKKNKEKVQEKERRNNIFFSLTFK